MNLQQHVAAAKHNCDITALLQWCYESGMLLHKGHKAQWPAVFYLMRYMSMVETVTDLTYRSLNTKYYQSLQREYLAAQSRSHLSVIPRDLRNSIERHLLQRRPSCRANLVKLCMLGHSAHTDIIPELYNKETCEYEFDKCFVRKDGPTTYVICGPNVSGCPSRGIRNLCEIGRCKVTTDIEVDFPELARGIADWHSVCEH